MAVINKTPKLNALLGQMSDEELGSLINLINGQGAAAIFRSLKPIAPAENQLTEADKGIKRIKLELAEPVGGIAVWEGYLIYNDSVCAMISYAAEEAQQLFLLEIDVAARKAQVTVAEHVSILELRSELADLTASGEGGGGGSGGGTQLYKHVISFSLTDTDGVTYSDLNAIYISSISEPFADVNALSADMAANEAITFADVAGGYGYLCMGRLKRQQTGSTSFTLLVASRIFANDEIKIANQFTFINDTPAAI